MTHRTIRSCTLASLLLLGTLLTPAAHAEVAGVTLLLPPNAAVGGEKTDALSEIKSMLKAEGYEVVAQGEFNPDQGIDLVEKGKATGIVTYEAGDQADAEAVQALLKERYPEIVVEERSKRNSPFPEDTLGVLLPSVVILEKVKEAEPPPWKLYLTDVTVDVEGSMSKADARGLFEDRQEDLVACWPKAVARGKTMEGQVTVKVTVDPGGEPVISSIQESPGLGELWVDCVSEAYLGWTFPKSPDGKSSKVTIGVRFVIFDDGAAPAGDEAEEPPAAE